MVVATTADSPLWTTSAPDFPLDVGVDGERITVGLIGPVVSDAFGRTVSSSWGNADTGQAYSTSGGASSDFNVSSGAGTMSATSVNAFRNALIDTGSSDHTAYVDVSLPLGTATGANATQWLLGRCADASNYYCARLELSITATVILTPVKRVGGSLLAIPGAAAITVGTGHVSGDWWRVGIDVHGSTLRFKAWLRSGPEPLWQIVAVDTDLTAGTLTGLQYRLESGNTNTLPVTLSVDNLAVVNPQTFTVVRGVGGTAIAHNAGAKVSLWQPGVIAL
jgi:hypothetical protein